MNENKILDAISNRLDKWTDYDLRTVAMVSLFITIIIQAFTIASDREELHNLKTELINIKLKEPQPFHITLIQDKNGDIRLKESNVNTKGRYNLSTVAKDGTQHPVLRCEEVKGDKTPFGTEKSLQRYVLDETNFRGTTYIKYTWRIDAPFDIRTDTFHKMWNEIPCSEMRND